MKRFARVKEILDLSIGATVIGAHGPFWRPLDLAGFVAKKVYGRRLVVPGDAARSNLLLALRGAFPFGSDLGVADAEYPRMPAGRPPVPETGIAFIEQWIRDGCPDDEVASAGE